MYNRYKQACCQPVTELANVRHNIHMNEEKFGALFANNQHAESYEDEERMQTEINKLGGMLHFTIRKDSDGWSAQCKEVPGIIAGSTSTDPDDSEIQTLIRDAIHSAFHVETKITPSQIKFKLEVTQLALSFV